MNRFAKGYRSMDKCRKLLEQQGWLVEVVERKGKFFKKKDLFNLFDLMAIKKDETLLVQVKTNKIPALKEYCDFYESFPQFTVQVWVVFDRKDVTIVDIGRYSKMQKSTAKASMMRVIKKNI